VLTALPTADANGDDPDGAATKVSDCQQQAESTAG
jgi:hypothetical protein